MTKIKNSNAPIKKNLSEDLKKAFQTLIAITLALSFFYGLMKLIGYFDNKRVTEIKKNIVLADGVIIKVGSMKGSYASARYFVNNHRYEIKEGSPADDVPLGQKYKIAYDEKKPESSIIIYEMPFFCATEKTDSTLATVIQDDNFNVRFRYYVNGVEYKRFQKKPSGVRYKIDSFLKVEYLFNNPIIVKIKDTITGSCF